MNLNLHSFGTANPRHTMSQQQATQLAIDVCAVGERQQRMLKILYRKSGVENRRTVLPHRIATEWVASSDNGGDSGAVESSRGPTTAERMQFYRQHASPLARQASAKALARSPFDAIDMTHLVTVSCTGFSAPGVDIDLINDLPLKADTQRVNVGFMGCHGAINGLRVAQALASSNRESRVLLCAVECCSLHYRFQWDPDRFVGNALFADGAAALVATVEPVGDDSLTLVDTASQLIPDSTDAMTWNVGNHGFEMYLSARVPDLIKEHLSSWLMQWLAEHDLEIDQVGGWAVHPGGPRILQAVEDSLRLPSHALSVSRDVLKTLGNMSSPTILFILDRLRQQGHGRPFVALGFGPGLIAEAALLK